MAFDRSRLARPDEPLEQGRHPRSSGPFDPERDLGAGRILGRMRMIRRLLQAFAIGYFALAILTRLREWTGAYTCACDDDCWCKTPGLRLFRWVYPRGHRNRALAEWKASQAGGE